MRLWVGELITHLPLVVVNCLFCNSYCVCDLITGSFAIILFLSRYRDYIHAFQHV